MANLVILSTAGIVTNALASTLKTKIYYSSLIDKIDYQSQSKGKYKTFHIKP